MKSKAVRKVKFASVIDQCNEGEVPALGMAQTEEHFENGSYAEGVFPHG